MDKLELDIFWWNKTAQTNNGLKHGDYRRYHLYCTRKLHRLRKALKWTQGRGRFVKRKVGEEDIVSKGGSGTTDVRFLLLVLLQAERAWSHGMELKEEAALLQNSKKRNKAATRRRRRWPLRKWTKAALWAKQLEKLCIGIAASTKTVLEAEAYAAWTSGNALLEKKRWKSSQESLEKSCFILEKLEQIKGTSAQQRYVYRQYRQEMEPAIRYCRYQLSKRLEENVENTLSIPDWEEKWNRLESELQAKENGASIITSIEWQGTRIPIANKRLQQYLQQIAIVASKIDENDPKSFEEMLSLYTRSIQLVSKEWEQVSMTEMDQQVTEELDMLKAYLVSNRFQLALRKNLIIWSQLDCNKATSRRRRIRIVEQCIQFCEEILKCYQSDTESYKFWSQRKVFFSAYRFYYLASYLLSRRMWADSYMLTRKASEEIQQISREDLRDEYIQQHLDALVENITRENCLSRAYAFLEEKKLIDKWNELKLDANESVSFKTPLVNRLQDIVFPNSFEVSTIANDWKIIDLEPSFMKAPCKPFLFDLASEQLTFPDMSLFANEETKSVEDTNAKRGLLGRAVSWFSGKK